MKISVIIPAHNEETYIGTCLECIGKAAGLYSGEVEVIVVANRCMDGTVEIARQAGAVIVENEDRSIAKIRNAGARVATGNVIVTIDADSFMSESMLVEVGREIETGRYVGGGCKILMERYSLGIHLSVALVLFMIWLTGLGGGMYWCRREDFEAIGGFDEKLIVAEDVEFAKRLKKHGRAKGMKFKNITKGHIVTSARKFDRFGDWFMFRWFLTKPRVVMSTLKGKPNEFSDSFFYDFNGK